MKKVGVTLIVIVAILASGGLFLMTWDNPPPLQEVEKVLPNDRFPK